MIFTETRLAGAFVIEPERLGDARGYFARTFCVREFAARGLVTGFVQHSVSFNAEAGTLRGMHFQRPPAEETKLVRCTEGAIWDVIVDIRPDSPGYLQSFGTELSGENGRQLYIPKGFAHGFQTLKPGSVVAYMIDEFFTPGAGDGLRFDDPALGLEWPLPVAVISEKDEAWPLLKARKA